VKPLLGPELLRRLEQLQLLAQRRAKTSAKGERRSRARGQSVEFADYRAYVPWDDLRYLDWNLFGRFERLFLRLYEEERELPVRLFLDASASMAFGTPQKFEFACKIAAAIGYVALCGFDRVSVDIAPAEGAAGPAGEGAAAAGAATEPARNTLAVARAGLRQVRGRKAALPFFGHLGSLVPGGRANLNEVLRRAALTARHAGVAIVLSDFLEPEGCERGLRALAARGFRTTVLHILAPEELQPATFGDLRLVDAESGATQEVTFGRFRMGAYRKAVEAFCGGLRDFCRNHGMNYVLAASDQPIEQLLLRQLRDGRLWE
jgi:uncharacterized protein (DUF58 family)